MNIDIDRSVFPTPRWIMQAVYALVSNVQIHRDSLYILRSGLVVLFVVGLKLQALCYMRPDFTTNRFGNRSMCYMGVGENKKWTSIETYGPKLVENIVQAIARDLLALAMLRLRNAGYEIVMHIHDEAVLEVPIGESSVEEICAIMGEAPDWAAGLPLRADGYECDFYKKD